jgi:phosphate transport system substrate-binding protein
MSPDGEPYGAACSRATGPVLKADITGFGHLGDDSHKTIVIKELIVTNSVSVGIVTEAPISYFTHITRKDLIGQAEDAGVSAWRSLFFCDAYVNAPSLIWPQGRQSRTPQGSTRVDRLVAVVPDPPPGGVALAKGLADMMLLRLALALSLASTLALAGGCQKSSGAAGAGGSTQSATSIAGAGATFPAPLYTKWAKDYHSTSGVALNYQGIGSGGGIKQIVAKTVDFGASDKPLEPDRLDKEGLYQFPTVIGGVVPVINAAGIGDGAIKLTGDLLGDIYLGDVTRWDDPKIAALNPGMKLPSGPITVVHRADGSGTTFLFTSYLSMVNPTWKAKAGANDSIKWPTGLGGKGNDGVALYVRQTPGSIGYVEYAYAKQKHFATAQLQNRDGVFLSPTADTFAAAAAHADWKSAPGNSLLLLDEPGPQSWPITGATFILLHRQPSDPAKTKAILTFFDWAYREGDGDAAGLDYVPLPQEVKDLVRGQWAANIKDANGQQVYAAAY